MYLDADRQVRVAIVGHHTYFENHFAEGWRDNPHILCLDVSEGDYSWLLIVRNFKPAITLFFRPELYPAAYLRHIGGLRVALLSEPLPPIVDGKVLLTDESALRIAVYRGMCWDAYHWCIYYDPGKAVTARTLGFRIDEFRPLPIDTDTFRPRLSRRRREIDVFFLGKATPHRIQALDFLRSSRLRFLWIAHGASGRQLARVLRNSRVVLNVHADGAAACEPRLYLAASCGCRVVTEPLSSAPVAFRNKIVQEFRPLDEKIIREHLASEAQQSWSQTDEKDRQELSTWRLINDLYGRLSKIRIDKDEKTMQR